jgi:transporter family protein
VIVLLLGLIVLWKNSAAGLSALDARGVIFLVLSGLATGASWICYFRALHLGDASKVAPVDKLSVVFVAVIAALFLGEHLSVSGWAGVALIAAGSILVALS